ncbi:MAG TPA: amidase [Actinomycetota bacterium]|nr:amidase [Actinomycetota bacterium]
MATNEAPPRRQARVIDPGSSSLDVARAVANGDVSPVEVVEEALDRIERLNPSVNAFAWIREAAIDDARAAEKRLTSGDRPRALEGVPFTVKDLCPIADGPTNKGSRAFEGHRTGVDAHVVSQLRAAGAVLIATTTSSEFGNRPTTETELFGTTRNPWNTDHTCGGSSGGAGVSAALGIAPLNQASDGGGSVRIPAFCNGVVGLKPQRGRISLAPLMSEEWGGLDVYGPITPNVVDAALFLDVTSGPATGDPYWAPSPERTFVSAMDEERPLRIAVAYERDGEHVDPSCKEAVRATADLLASLGHHVEEAQPDLLPLQDPFLVVSTVGIGMLDLTDEQLALLEERTRHIFNVAPHITAVEYARKLDAMHAASRTVLAFWRDHDILLTPTLSRPAPPIGTIGADIENAWDDYRNWLCWTWPFNCTGQPAISVPAGFSPDGLPVGVQLVGDAAAERTIISAAAQLERARPWTERRPPIW